VFTEKLDLQLYKISQLKHDFSWASKNAENKIFRVRVKQVCLKNMSGELCLMFSMKINIREPLFHNGIVESSVVPKMKNGMNICSNESSVVHSVSPKHML